MIYQVRDKRLVRETSGLESEVSQEAERNKLHSTKPLTGRSVDRDQLSPSKESRTETRKGENPGDRFKENRQKSEDL